MANRDLPFHLDRRRPDRVSPSLLLLPGRVHEALVQHLPHQRARQHRMDRRAEEGVRHSNVSRNFINKKHGHHW